MTPQESQLIEGLFQRLKEADGSPKDREAADLITRRTVEQPTAPYLLVQTVLVQQHALDNAQARITQLESELAEARRAPAPASGGASFLGGLFGRPGSAPREQPAALRPAVPAPQPAPQAFAQPPAAGSVPITTPSAGGSFLHSALATAAGVAGGALLFDGIRSLFFHNPGPFGSALGGGWGQAAGGGALETTNVVNNYYGDDAHKAGTAASDPAVADASTTANDTTGGGLQDASYDAGSDAGLDGGFDTASGLDAGGGDFGGSDFA
ncbi:MAG: DUF2076 domain-containing protein [Alphaproteobacteria bacterium]